MPEDSPPATTVPGDSNLQHAQPSLISGSSITAAVLSTPTPVAVREHGVPGQSQPHQKKKIPKQRNDPNRPPNYSVHPDRKGRREPSGGQSTSSAGDVRQDAPALSSHVAEESGRSKEPRQRRMNTSRRDRPLPPQNGAQQTQTSGKASGRSSPSAAASASGQSGQSGRGDSDRHPKSRGEPFQGNARARGAPHRTARGRHTNMNVNPRSAQGEKGEASSAPSSSTSVPAANQEKKDQPHPRSHARPAPALQPGASNLTNRLIEALRTPPYADCPICFNSIHPAQPIWSCSPSSKKRDISFLDDDHADRVDSDLQCCYTPFHLKCIKSWAQKSVNDMRDAYRTRGEMDKEGDWRCPGCQSKRADVPSSYMCFCGSTPNPRPAHLATPHSCGNPCSRPRICGHACPLSCHPGPCPPCQILTHLPCHCGRQNKAFRCADLTALKASSGSTTNASDSARPNALHAHYVDLSCGTVCDKSLSCGKHRCTAKCHPGACPECPIVETGRCYCGKKTRELKCGEGEEKKSRKLDEGGSVEEWDGRFACDEPCGQYFDCSIHKCEKPCHPLSAELAVCPRSPSIVTHCPCGKKLLGELEGGMRTKCTDPIATCGNLCEKKLDGCDHVCSVPCHIGPCPPCTVPLVIPCRCGSTTRSIPCHDLKFPDSPLEILCDRPCTALRACGRHRCNRVCCPLASLSALTTKSKGKKRAQAAHPQLQTGLEDTVLGSEAHWHECDLVCGKLLGCGNHHCEEKDHRGACRPCLRSSFEEMICHCGQTIIEPPVPCGTRISCSYPCSRPPPPCGHPKSPHSCHEDPTPCPPCPFLTSKVCACGKNTVPNIRCSQEKVSCGTACGKLLDCGFHHCERLCHGGDCGSCTSACGKPRKLCLPAHHSCAAPCHAPASCSEDEPCQTIITLKCPCGRIQQPSLCGRCTTSPLGREASQQLKCTNECAVAKRNAKLAEAFGISQDVKEGGIQKPTTYTDELQTFARANAKFCALVEKTFAEFTASERKSQVLPYMPESRRKFVHDLAAVYRISTQMVDQEPRRSVQLIRRIDSRIPKPLLSESMGSNTLGRLADLRQPTPAPAPRQSTSTLQPHAPPRGWGSVTPASVTTSSATPSTAASPIPWSARLSGPDASASVTRPVSQARPVVQSRQDTTSINNVNRVVEAVPDSWEADDA